MKNFHSRFAQTIPGRVWLIFFKRDLLRKILINTAYSMVHVRVEVVQCMKKRKNKGLGNWVKDYTER